MNKSEMLHGLRTDYLHPCALHSMEETFIRDGDNPPGCQECGKLLNWDSCIWCEMDWLVFGSGGDDVMADASVTSSGDVMCYYCAVRVEEEEMEGEWEEDYLGG